MSGGQFVTRAVEWRLKGARAPETSLPIPPMIWQILYSRGLRSSAEVQDWLKPTLRNLRSPFLLDQMNVAVDRLLLAREAGEQICIYADFDMDGTSGLALLKTGLEELGFVNLITYQPKRLSEGYGVHEGAIEEIRTGGTKVLITVDVGTSAVEVLSRAQANGLDVIVTDHHLPQPTLPRVLALVNPNKGTCNSGLGHLSGAGVAYYLYLALRGRLNEKSLNINPQGAKELLDFFVIGTITDLVPLVAENRVLVRHGLNQLAKTNRPGLRALIDRLGLAGREISSVDVAMKIAPKLNALSRLEADLMPIDLFLEEDPARAEAYATRVLELNDERLRLQRTAEAEARKTWLERHGAVDLAPGFVFSYSTDYHRGVVGLVATRLAQEFARPAFVGAMTEEGRIVGSARLGKENKINLVEALQSCSEHLVKFGGHSQAAGFEVELAEVSNFESALHRFFSAQETLKCEQKLSYDAEGALDDLNSEFMKWFEAIGPFGKDFEVPLLKLSRVKILKVTEVKGGHLRFEFQDRASRLGGIWFSPDPEVAERLKSHNPGQVNLVATPEWNHWQGSKSLQLQVKDLVWT